ncbi:MAG TPA: TIGR03557 family F420-dependent LLM class oxidoreductase [Nitrolancea sp.]|nr:TIGR03557 family F420-dependent LLM class oxidoreductase [Nitrolancea sp.]
MATITLGYHLSTEEHPPMDLVRYAQMAEATGLSFATMSDHFHPWLDQQGQSPFAWTTLGAVVQATTKLHVGTAVTCPFMRYRPEIVAQSAATVAALAPGRFFLGLGTGEYLNEHIQGRHWPPIAMRQEMLTESIDIIRALWRGDWTSHHGKHFTLEDARLYTLPDQLPSLYVAAVGPQSATIAGQTGDGLISTAPNAKVVSTFEEAGGRGKPRFGQLSMCWAKDMATARRTAFNSWRNQIVPGSLHANLPLPNDFDQISQLGSEDSIAKKLPLGPDPETYISRIQKYVEAGFDHVILHQIGPDQQGFFDFIGREVLPKIERQLVGSTASRSS